MKALRVLVTGGGALLGQGLIRTLRNNPRLSAYVIAVDVSPLSAGLYWADEAYLVSKATAADYLDSVEAVLERSRPDVVLIGTDVELTAFATARARLEEQHHTRIIVSSPEVIAIAEDKFRTAQFFIANGFAAPASAVPEDAAALRALVERHGFPLLVKPRVGARSYGVSVVRTPDELHRALAAVDRPVVQELVGTADQEYTASGLCFDGSCNAVIVMRRDLRDGNTYRAFVASDPALDEWVRRWTVALQPFGPANFQFRIGDDGVPRVFEINGRFSGTTPLRARAGFDEVDICIRHVLWGEAVTQPPISPLTFLRHWSETVVEHATIDRIQPA